MARLSCSCGAFFGPVNMLLLLMSLDEDAGRQEIRLGKRPIDEMSPAVGVRLARAQFVDSQATWPLLGGRILDEDTSFDVWPHIDLDFVSRLSGPTSWDTISATDSSILARSAPLSAGGGISASGFGSFEAGSSSFIV